MIVKELKEKLEKCDENFQVAVNVFDDHERKHIVERIYDVKVYEEKKEIIIFA